MRCTRCGASLPETALFCGACATPVARPDAPTGVPLPPPDVPAEGAGPAGPPAGSPEDAAFWETASRAMTALDIPSARSGPRGDVAVSSAAILSVESVEPGADRVAGSVSSAEETSPDGPTGRAAESLAAGGGLPPPPRIASGSSETMTPSLLRMLHAPRRGRLRTGLVVLLDLLLLGGAAYYFHTYLGLLRAYPLAAAIVVAGSSVAAAPPGVADEPVHGDDAAVQAVVHLHLEDVRTCYSRQLGSNPGLAGIVRVAFSIGADGHAIGVHVLSNTTGSRPLADCIAQRLGVWPFPKTASSDMVFTFPFSFHAG